MATVQLKMVLCVMQASGTDIGVVQALSQLADPILASQYAGIPLNQVVAGLSTTIAAFDAARSDPDDLFITTGSSDLANRIWPIDRQTFEIRSSQPAVIMLDVQFQYALNLSLWDYDSVSRNDLLGSITVREDEAGLGEIARLAKSDIEGSAYYIFYEVFA